jgi:hypothetical protein
MRKVFALLALSLLAGCVPSVTPPPRAPQPRPVPPPLPAPAPTPTPSGDWRDWPLTPGDWRYQPTATGSTASFGTPGTPQFVIECNRASRSIGLYREQPVAGAMSIITTSATRLLQTRLAGNPPTAAGATLAASDPLLDAMGYSRGRFVVEQPGLSTLVIPAWPEIERVTEDCRK